ncbi:MAG: MarR family transcriptional regulator [Micropruina sp.]
MSQARDIPQSEYDAAANALMDNLGGSLDKDAFRAVYLLHQAADAAREYATREALARFSISWTQFEVLWNMWIFGESEAGWVARAAMVSKSGLTTVIAELERRGLVHRRVDSRDRRKALLRVTAQGAVLLEAVVANINKFDRTFVSPLSADQMRQFREILEALLTGPYSADVDGAATAPQQAG